MSLFKRIELKKDKKDKKKGPLEKVFTLTEIDTSNDSCINFNRLCKTFDYKWSVQTYSSRVAVRKNEDWARSQYVQEIDKMSQEEIWANATELLMKMIAEEE